MLATLAWIALFLAGGAAQDAPRPAAPVSPQTPATQQTTQSNTTVAGFRITGRVVDSMSKAPVAGAYVAMSSSAAPSLNRTVRAGTDGGFAFTQIPAGRYVLRARRKGYIEQMYLQHEQFTTAIVVGPNLNSESLVFPLAREGVISGEVTDEAGEPIQSAKMILFREDIEAGRHAKHFQVQRTTDEEGRYRFGGLASGNYYLAVSAQPWYAEYARGISGYFPKVVAVQEPGPANPNLDVTYPITYYPNAIDASGAAAIRVESGGSALADMRLVPVPALHIRLEVDDTDPHTMTLTRVTQTILGEYHDQASPSFRRAMDEAGPVDGDGTAAGPPTGPRFIELDGLRPGPSVVEVTTGKAGETWQSSRVTRLVPVDPSDGQTLDVRGVSPAGVSGIVKLEASASAPAGANVFLTSAAKGTVFRAAVDSTGNFRFSDQIESGAYAVSARGPGGLQMQSVTASGATVAGSNIEITKGSDAQLVLTLAHGVNAHLKGIVEQGGKSAAGLMVVLVPEDLRASTAYRRDQTDSDGSFSMAQVLPGKYTVIAVSDWQLEWMKPEVIREYLAAGTPVEVAGGEEREVKVTAK